jgi:hypothetical protein
MNHALSIDHRDCDSNLSKELTGHSSGPSGKSLQPHRDEPCNSPLYPAAFNIREMFGDDHLL